MYKSTSDNAQRQARQVWISDLVIDGPVALTPEQERQNLVAKMLAIEKQIQDIPKWKPGAVQKRASLGREKFALQQAIVAIRPKLKGPHGVANHFINVCREQMTAAQFRRVMDEASKRARAESSNAHHD